MDRIAGPLSNRAPGSPGALLLEDGVEFSVFSRHGDAVFVCLFVDSGERETARWRLGGRDDDIHHGFIPGVRAGARYGLRVEGPYDPARAHLFDPLKFLVDPRATRVDRPFVWRPELGLARDVAVDTAPFMPRAIVEAPMRDHAPPAPSARPGLMYEMAVRGFSMKHPGVAPEKRGTLAALAEPAVIAHLVRLGVTHVELMPVAAYMSEPHLVRLGLENAWGYNSACFMALDPRLAPGGLADLRVAVDALRAAGISTILDVVFNHTAESDLAGPTLNLRGIDNAVYYRHDGSTPPRLINDTGCGNTLASERSPVVSLIRDTLRHFVEGAGVDGFRFDLAATLMRDAHGFPSPHPLLEAIEADVALKGRLMIAEPWDVGPGGYRLGAFPPSWLEWNDRYRDDVRKFWRGDDGALGPLATRIAGSADIFQASRPTPSASVNFIAAHDGFSLLDTVSCARKHNEANGEQNRDGSNDNHSWNHGVEGATTDAAVNAARARDVRALLACLFISRGAPMLTAGDEFGRTQRGNNNAYAQDNETTWLDWAHADGELAAYVSGLARLRRELAPLNADAFLNGDAVAPGEPADVAWLRPDGAAADEGFWRHGDALCLALCARGQSDDAYTRVFIAINRARESLDVAPPVARPGHAWIMALDSHEAVVSPSGARAIDGPVAVAARGVIILREAARVNVGSTTFMRRSGD